MEIENKAILMSPSNESEENQISTEGKLLIKEKDLEVIHPRIYGKTKTQEIEIVRPKCKWLLATCIIAIPVSIILIVFLSLSNPYLLPIPCLLFILSIFLLCNFTSSRPNQARVYTYCGNYVGTTKQVGCYFSKPCHPNSVISLKSEYFNGNMIKVNERGGNPVLLGCIAIWRVKDTAKVLFDVLDYSGFVRTQTESAVRYVGCKYPYEPIKPGEPSLRGGEEEINHALREELERRVFQAGIEIEDARITEISLGPEVANLMLKKQSAHFVVDAKLQIVKGAVNSVAESLKELEERNVIKFTQEEKNNYASNMMVVLCMENNASPLIKMK